MGKQVHLNDAQAAAVFNLIDVYLRTEAVGDDLTDLFVVRMKINRMWGFKDVSSLSRFDADRLAADAAQNSAEPDTT